MFINIFSVITWSAAILPVILASSLITPTQMGNNEPNAVSYRTNMLGNQVKVGVNRSESSAMTVDDFDWMATPMSQEDAAIKKAKYESNKGRVMFTERNSKNLESRQYPDFSTVCTGIQTIAVVIGTSVAVYAYMDSLGEQIAAINSNTNCGITYTGGRNINGVNVFAAVEFGPSDNMCALRNLRAEEISRLLQEALEFVEPMGASRVCAMISNAPQGTYNTSPSGVSVTIRTETRATYVCDTTTTGRDCTAGVDSI